MALKYGMTCKYISDKLDKASPDNALAYTCIASIMFKIREYEWAIRFYLGAKELREYTNGGDSADCATIYNNLGVCSYMLENYYISNGYFQLAYEIYKKILGYI
jgi:tetratricopeptide (TPR) repeat protein